MGVGDDKLDPLEAPGDQTAQKSGPSRTVFGGDHIQPKNLAMTFSGDGGGDHDSHIDDATGLSAADDHGIEPHIRIGLLVKRAVAKSFDLLVE
jgi:hypothetical protein